MKMLKALALMAFATTAAAQDVPQLRAAMLETGTVNWEISTIKSNGFDTANGFELAVQSYADNAATRIAFEGGEADVVVADWIWVAMMRAEGRDYVFIPYSRAVGGLVVKADSGITSIPDLVGQKIGIAGGPLDKSWLILRAYAQKEFGIDIAAETEQVFGAPPLIMQAGMDGETQGSMNFWHFLAKMKAGGMVEVASVAEMSAALGLDPDTPLLGYVLKAEFVAEHPEVAQGLARASRAAKDLLATDDAAWIDLREKMNAADDAQYGALIEGYRAGIPAAKPVDVASADAMLKIMAELGGEELVGKATSVEGVFLDVE